MAESRHRDTAVVHAGAGLDPGTGAVAPPLVTTSIYGHGAHPEGVVYGRNGNPVWSRLEAVLVAIEGGAGARLFGSGMAALSAVLELVAVGARVVAPDTGYQGLRALLAHHAQSGRLAVTLVDVSDTDAVARAAEGAALVHLESVTNPLLTVCDLGACAAAAHAAGALVSVDNTVTPLRCRPFDLGADLVVHSLTKSIGGHADLLLGGVVARDPALLERLDFLRLEQGGIPGALEAWLALRGARTVALRTERQCANALAVARAFEGHADVVRVTYPGLPSHPHYERAQRLLHGGAGALVALEVHGGAERAEAVCAAVRVWTHATSLGGVESLVERRGRYPAEADVCPPGLLRLSCGIEHAGDLIADLEQALSATR